MLPQRSAVWLAILTIIIGTLVLVADDPPRKEQDKKKSGFTISQETTYATGPLREGCYIDYVAALNERLKKGVTPENNAIVLLVRALGPAPEGRLIPAEYFKQLGCEPPALGGKYFMDYVEFMKKEKNIDIDNEDPWKLLDEASSRPWAKEQHPTVDAWLERNTEAMKWVAEASKRPKLYSPLLGSPDKAKYSGIMGVSNPYFSYTGIYLAAAFRVRAMRSVHENRPAQALEDVLLCHRMARLVAQDSTTPDFLCGLSWETYAIDAALVCLQHPSITVDQIKSYRDAVTSLAPMPGLADKMDLSERLQFHDSLQLTMQHGMKYLERLAGGSDEGIGAKVFDMFLLQSLDWDPAHKKANAWYDRMAATLRMTDRRERNRACEEMEDELKQLRKRLSKEIGQLLVQTNEQRVTTIHDLLRCLLTPAALKVQIAADQVEQRQRHLQVAIALALYHRETGGYPEKLSELAPKYLRSIPLDLFSSKEIIYARTGKDYRFYSVGPNGRDDGGRRDEEDRTKADDIMVEVPLPALKK